MVRDRAGRDNLCQPGFSVVGREGRPWLVWLHGFLGSTIDFQPFAEQLAPEFRSLLIDLPAHGLSVDVPAVSVEAAADAVARTVTAAGIASAILLGYSLGARVSLSLLSRHPHLFRAVVLESGSPGIIGTAARTRRVAADDALASHLTMSSEREFLNVWYGQRVFRSLARDPAAKERLVASRRIPDRSAMAKALRAFSPGQQEPMWHVLSAQSCPLLFIGGALDGKYVAIGRRVKGAARRAELAVVPKAGHIVHFERPVAYFGALRSFVLKNSNVI